MQTEGSGSTLPSDLLMKKLVDLLNSDNPPCANCDKRDRSSMYFCTTCSKLLTQNTISKYYSLIRLLI